MTGIVEGPFQRIVALPQGGAGSRRYYPMQVYLGLTDYEPSPEVPVEAVIPGGILAPPVFSWSYERKSLGGPETVDLGDRTGQKHRVLEIYSASAGFPEPDPINVSRQGYSETLSDSKTFRLGTRRVTVVPQRSTYDIVHVRSSATGRLARYTSASALGHSPGSYRIELSGPGADLAQVVGFSSTVLLVDCGGAEPPGQLDVNSYQARLAATQSGPARIWGTAGRQVILQVEFSYVSFYAAGMALNGYQTVENEQVNELRSFGKDMAAARNVRNSHLAGPYQIDLPFGRSISANISISAPQVVDRPGDYYVGNSGIYLSPTPATGIRPPRISYRYKFPEAPARVEGAWADAHSIEIRWDSLAKRVGFFAGAVVYTHLIPPDVRYRVDTAEASGRRIRVAAMNGIAVHGARCVASPNALFDVDKTGLMTPKAAWEAKGLRPVQFRVHRATDGAWRVFGDFTYRAAGGTLARMNDVLMFQADAAESADRVFCQASGPGTPQPPSVYKAARSETPPFVYTLPSGSIIDTHLTGEVACDIVLQ